MLPQQKQHNDGVWKQKNGEGSNCKTKITRKRRARRAKAEARESARKKENMRKNKQENLERKSVMINSIKISCAL